MFSWHSSLPLIIYCKWCTILTGSASSKRKWHDWPTRRLRSIYSSLNCWRIHFGTFRTLIRALLMTMLISDVHNVVHILRARVSNFRIQVTYPKEATAAYSSTDIEQSSTTVIPKHLHQPRAVYKVIRNNRQTDIRLTFNYWYRPSL